jgi:hypothetical protein
VLAAAATFPFGNNSIPCTLELDPALSDHFTFLPGYETTAIKPALSQTAIHWPPHKALLRSFASVGNLQPVGSIPLSAGLQLHTTALGFLEDQSS